MSDFMTSILLWGIGIGIPTVIIGAVEVFLASRKNKRTGLIIPIASILIIVPMVIIQAGMMIHPIPTGESRYGDETLDDVKIYIDVILDDNEEITAFSDLKVKNRETGKNTYYSMEFDKNGKLTAGEDALKYKAKIERLVDGKAGFVGKSHSVSEMKRMYVKENFKLYRDFGFILSLQLLPIPVYFIIYKIMRKRVRQKEAVKGIDKMMIEDL